MEGVLEMEGDEKGENIVATTALDGAVATYRGSLYLPEISPVAGTCPVFVSIPIREEWEGR